MEQKTPFRELSGKAKLQYIWDYYKLPIGGVLILLAILISVIHYYATYKDPVLTLMLVNSSIDAEDTTIQHSFDSFMEENNYNPARQEVAFSKNLFLDMSNPQGPTGQTLVSLDVMTGGRGISAIFSDPDNFDGLAERSYFLDITDYLTDEQIREHQDDLVYTADTDTNERYAAGIRLTKEKCKWLQDTGAYEECVVGICYDSNNHPDAQKALLTYLLGE